jgi:hypothetical protein
MFCVLDDMAGLRFRAAASKTGIAGADEESETDHRGGRVNGLLIRKPFRKKGEPFPGQRERLWAPVGTGMRGLTGPVKPRRYNPAGDAT